MVNYMIISMKIVVFTQVYFFEVKGSRQQLLVEAANGVTRAIQGLKICSGVINPRILGRGIYPQDSKGGIYPQDSRGGG